MFETTVTSSIQQAHFVQRATLKCCDITVTRHTSSLDSHQHYKTVRISPILPFLIPSFPGPWPFSLAMSLNTLLLLNTLLHTRTIENLLMTQNQHQRI